MCKKFFFLVGGVSLVSFLLFGTATVSHIKQGVSWVRGQVEESVPVEFELERARTLIRETDPQIRECKRLIAEKQVEMRYLDHQVRELEVRQTQDQDSLRAQHACLTENKSVYMVRGRRVSYAEIEQDATRMLTRVKTNDQILSSKRERLTALSRNLDYAKETLEKLITQKAQLEAQVELLHTKRMQTEAMKAATLNINVDTSSLAQAKKIIEEVSKKLDVEQQIMENDQPLVTENLLPSPVKSDVTEQISTYLGNGQATVPAETVAVQK